MATNIENKRDSLKKNIFLIISLLLAAFVVYTSATSPLSPMLQRSLILLAMVYISVLAKPMKGKYGPLIDAVIAIIATITLGYIIFSYKDLLYRSSFAPVTFEVILGGLLILVFLELTRRCIGWPLVIIAAVCILYAVFGRYLPPAIAHKGYPLSRVITSQYITNAGIFGTMVGTLSTTIAPFVFFGSVLSVVGVGELMVDTAMVVSRNSKGGPAKMAVIASGLFGMVSGSSTSNVVTTGCTTIPLMKDTGYDPDFAGAVEAAASTGGQFMPPIMGAAAFLMSYVTGISYITIAIAAIIPAIFYFVSIFIEVDLEARRLDLKPLATKLDKGHVSSILKRCYMFIPFVVLVILLMRNWSCAKSAIIASGLSLALACINPKTRISWKLIKEISLNFAKSMVSVSIACATAGIVIGSLNLTGSTLRLTYAFVALADGRLFILMLCVAALCIILGMGLPTPAAYSVAASFAAPALTQVGVSVLASHMFVLYYASLSSITPPVALAAYAAAGLSGGNPMKTGWKAWRLALTGFIVPFMFVYGPALLIGEASAMATISSAISGLIGIFILSMSTIGYFKGKLGVVERILLLIPAGCLIHSGTLTDIIGLVTGAILIGQHLLRQKNNTKVMEA